MLKLRFSVLINIRTEQCENKLNELERQKLATGDAPKAMFWLTKGWKKEFLVALGCQRRRQQFLRPRVPTAGLSYVGPTSETAVMNWATTWRARAHESWAKEAVAFFVIVLPRYLHIVTHYSSVQSLGRLGRCGTGQTTVNKWAPICFINL